MRVIHYVIISTLFLTTIFGVVPNKKTHQENDLGARSSQLTSSRVVTSHSYFNGNEWYAKVVNDGQWATDALVSGSSGGLWPRGTNNSVLYDAGLWISFRDHQDIIQFSGVKWQSDYTPGPYGTTDSENESYRVYKVNRWDDATVSDWSDWPEDMGAPWEDNNGDGTYDPAVDQPFLPLDQTLYSVYNDSTDHNVFGTSINGIEVHQTIFGGVSSAHSDLSRTFFIKYEIINKGSLSWYNPRFGVWSDVDLGDYGNDAIGVDVDSNMVYCYSAEAGAETDVFGISPSVGFRYISSLNNLDDNLSSGGCIGSDCSYLVGGNYLDPNSAHEVYNRMLGLDNEGNNINDPSGNELLFTHTGDPVTGTGWIDEMVNERQMFFSVASNQELIEPGDTVGFVMAVIIAQGTDNLNSITELRDASYEAKSLWNSNFSGVGLVDRPILESGEDYGLFSDFRMPSVGPGNTVQLERTYHNGGNEILNISLSSDEDGYSIDPASVTISPGDHASLTFEYAADNYSTTVHQVPSSYSTIQGAVDAAMQTNFSATIELIDNDNYNQQSYVSDYSYTGDTIMVAPGTYTENIHIDNKSINLIATDGDPGSTIIDGNNTGRVIEAENGIGLFSLNGFTIQNGWEPGAENGAGGGITVYGSGSINITNNIFKNNNAGDYGYGGGLYTWYVTGTVSRNIFINNTANYGSAARLNHGGINFYNNTLWNNDLIDWGVVYVRSSDHRIINNIIWDNDGGDFTYIQANHDPTVEYNIVKNDHDGTGNINDDPLLYDPDNGDFRLTAFSPAIDAGDPDLDNDGEDYETDGDDQDPDGTRMDMGADLNRFYSISDARALDLDVSVTVEGVVTSHNRSTTHTFYSIQDSTAGISFFLGDTVMNFQLGDELRVSGTLYEWYSLLEILPGDASNISIVSQNNPLPDYQLLTMQEYLSNGEGYESELIRFSDVVFVSGDWPSEGSSSDMVISDDEGTTTLTMYIDSDTEIDGQAQPNEPFFVSGTGYQYNDGYTIHPQDYHDLSTTTDAGFENSYDTDNDWQSLPTFWEWYPENGGSGFPSLMIEEDGANVDNSDSIFHAYDGSNFLKMWGLYDGQENSENNVFQTYYINGNEDDVVEPGQKYKIESMMLIHQDVEWDNNYVQLFAKYFTSDWGWLGGDFSEPFDNSFELNIWHPMSVVSTVPENTEIVQFGVMLTQPSSDDHGNVCVDNLTAFRIENIILSPSIEHTVHGDTALVEIQISGLLPSLSSIDLSFSGFQDKLIFHDIITDGYMFGNLGWLTQVNNTDELLITASAGADAISDNGALFALELIVPDTLSTQFVPIVISDFLGNTDITDGTFLDGGVEVVWEPTANFISDTTTGYLPLVISFTDTSEIGTYPINQWTWDFGDDSTATGADVEHTYTQEGQYTVTLTVTDEFGLSDTLVMDDYIDALHPIYPVAGFSASVTSGGYPLSVTFTDTSNMGTYEINDWFWDFGNDSTGSGSSVSMSYERPGEFDVTLTITDEYGLSDTLTASSFIQVDTTFGDVDWNTNVQSFDASLILQDLVEMIELDSLQTLIADVSGDSSLSTLDATLILQYVVGLIDELPYIPDSEYLATGDLTMSDQGADPGMLVEIPINISNGSNIYGFTGTINYDHNILNYDTLLLSDYLEGYLVAFNELSPGEIKIAASGNNPDGETGVFSTLVFYVTDAFTEETSISITDLTWNEGEMIELAAEMSITYGLGIDGVAIPDVFALHQNYPNPFNPVTRINYDLPEDAMVNIMVYDMMGRRVKTLIKSKQNAGYWNVRWNGTNTHGETVSAGMYIYTIQAGDFRQVKKMVLLK